MGERKTYYYGDEAQCIRAAQEIYERYGEVAHDPARGRTQTIALIQIALRQAFSQGIVEGKAARPDPNPATVQTGER